MSSRQIHRREFFRIGVGAAALLPPRGARGLAGDTTLGRFRLNYILASSLYGRLPIAEVLGETRRAGADWIDIWPEPHANHREQIEALGHERFARLLDQQEVRVGVYTCYHPGILECRPWMSVVRKFGGSMIVSGAGGPKGLTGTELKSALKKFAERIKRVLDDAGEAGLTIAIENHGGGLLATPESLPALMDVLPQTHVGIAYAPYHLPQDAQLQARLIRQLGSRLVHFYAWEHGEGSSKAMPKVLEMKQLPGYGRLDFRPLVAALKQIGFGGWTSIFMHPVPRGIPILPTASEVTAAVNRAREYLDACLNSD